MEPPNDLSLVAFLRRSYSDRAENSVGAVSAKYSSLSLIEIAVELRKSRRYRLLAPASFLWERLDGLLEEGRGVIRDVSDRSVYVTGDIAPPFGAHLEVDVYLPSVEVGGGAVQLHGEGTVVRVDREAEGIKGFAATVAFQPEVASGPTVVNPRRLQ
jgi:hypothetical protein